MAKIERTINHSLGLEGAKASVSKLVDSLKEKYGSLISEIKWNEDKTSASMKGKGFSGNFTLSESDVKIAIELGLLTSAFKGKVEEEIDKHAGCFTA